MRILLASLALSLTPATVLAAQTGYGTDSFRYSSPPSAWRDVPVSPGIWRYSQDARGSVALFGRGGQDAMLVLRCDFADRQVYLSRSGSSTQPLTIRTTSIARTVSARRTGGEQAYVAVALAPNDPLLDAMGFSRGKFAVEQSGLAPLVVPAWPEIERVTEDCRH